MPSCLVNCCRCLAEVEMEIEGKEEKGAKTGKREDLSM
jgi:hypothetical protein